MRVITGSAKGIALKTVPDEEVRPTTDRVKESLFTIIQFDIEGRSVLDLFAGTGQLGIEALSRGAARAVFVDNSKQARNIISENLRRTGFSGRARLIASDYKAYLKNSEKRSVQLLFLDPPYRRGYLERILSFVETFDIMQENGIIICESDSGEKLPEAVGSLRLLRSYKYGGTALWLYRREPGESVPAAPGPPRD